MRTTHTTGPSGAKGEPYRGYEPDDDGIEVDRDDAMEHFRNTMDLTKADYAEMSATDKEEMWENYEQFLADEAVEQAYADAAEERSMDEQ